MSGVLYIVATPIGNLKDITYRAVEVLGGVDMILDEDTRTSSKLLDHYLIKKPIKAFHDHNESEKTEWVIERLEAGESLALISDAGTPLISDPGYKLVHSCREKGLEVVPIPGACAVVAALSASGLPTDKFTFIGFLPAKSVGLQKLLDEYAARRETLIAYESTHRLAKTLSILSEKLPGRQLVLGKELTKQFEAIVSGTAAEIESWLREDERRLKGEFVLMVSPAEEIDGDDHAELLKTLGKYLSVKEAAKCAAELTGVSKNELYKQCLALKR